MKSENNERDIEIIPPKKSDSRTEAEWIYISFDERAKAFAKMPLYKRILLGASWLASLALVLTIIFLIIASAVLIWIPLLLAAIIIGAIVMFLRGTFRTRI